MTRILAFALLATMTGCGAPAYAATPLDTINENTNTPPSDRLSDSLRKCYLIGQLMQSYTFDPNLEALARKACSLHKDDPSRIQDGGEGAPR